MAGFELGAGIDELFGAAAGLLNEFIAEGDFACA